MKLRKLLPGRRRRRRARGGHTLHRMALAAGVTGNLLALGLFTTAGAVLIGASALLVGMLVRPLRLLRAPALAITAVGMVVHLDPPSTLVLLAVSWALILPRLVALLLALAARVTGTAVASGVQHAATSRVPDRTPAVRPVQVTYLDSDGRPYTPSRHRYSSVRDLIRHPRGGKR
jgi:hypothetical protein